MCVYMYVYVCTTNLMKFKDEKFNNIIYSNEKITEVSLKWLGKCGKVFVSIDVSEYSHQTIPITVK